MEVMGREKGYTLVELLLVMAILAIMMVISVMTLNSMGLMGRGNDTRRKNDLKKIKTAFEEYFSDRGNYPTYDLKAGQVGVAQLMDKANCGSKVFEPWLSTWPCDPNGNPYYISVEPPKDGVDEPHWFKVLAKLENESDKGIPENWGGNTVHYGNGEYSADQVNYGVSSTNVNWYDATIWNGCYDSAYTGCYTLMGNCKIASDGCGPPNLCYLRFGCDYYPLCQVESCGN